MRGFSEVVGRGLSGDEGPFEEGVWSDRFDSWSEIYAQKVREDRAYFTSSRSIPLNANLCQPVVECIVHRAQWNLNYSSAGKFLLERNQI